MDYPIPVNLPLYRGNCVLHAREAVKAGEIIWQQPQARTLHAPPNGVSHFFWRFLLIGHDYYWQKQLMSAEDSRVSMSEASMSGIRDKLKVFLDRVRGMIRHDRRHLFFLPFALPTAIAASLLIYIGYRITVWKPDYLLSLYNKILGEI